MIKILQIIKAIDEFIERENLIETTPVEINFYLEKIGLLNDSSLRKGKPIRDILRDNKIPHAYQIGNRWFIPHSGINFKRTDMKLESENKIESKKSVINKEINKEGILDGFKKNCFDPILNNENEIDDKAGNYIICLREKSSLPKTKIDPSYHYFNNYKVIYNGISSNSLRTRDYRQHFKGNNAGRSTLRKSLGVLFGYDKIPRSKGESKGRIKFNEIDEQKLTEWMNKNLVMFFYSTNDYEEMELMLINYFNPPLNLKDNHNEVNKEFRAMISDLRKNK